MTLAAWPGERLDGVGFGESVSLGDAGLTPFLQAAERSPAALHNRLDGAGGLLVLRDCQSISDAPSQLVRLSQLFGPTVENCRNTITSANFFHESVDEILVLSNLPPCDFSPPPKPRPELDRNGQVPVSWPQRNGWHMDQSYRRPPPDVSLLYGVTCPPSEQGQTLYSDGISNYEALDETLRQRVNSLEGIHAMRGCGHTGREVHNEAPVRALKPNQLPQRQPLVRRHPRTGKLSLYLCDEVQMDYIDGPLANFTPGFEGEGAELIAELLTHCTNSERVYAHLWREGDLVIHDNRNMLHAPTWYDAVQYPRTMWRTTVSGAFDPAYAGERPSWTPTNGGHPMAGLEDLRIGSPGNTR